MLKEMKGVRCSDDEGAKKLNKNEDGGHGRGW